MSFDVAPKAYDSFMGRYSAPLAVEFVRAAGLPAAGRALDVGCGTGSLTAVLVERYGQDEVAAVDPSASFVASTAARFPWADIRHGVAEDLPFADGVFDAALAQLVVHFMTDASAGAREMVRVTRPGGVVAVCVWDFSGGRAPQSRFLEAFAEVVRGIDDGATAAGAVPGDLGALLERAGCGDVSETEISVALEHATFEDWWLPYTYGVSPAGQQLAALDEATRERVRLRCVDLLPPPPFTITATAWSARGVA